MSEGTAAGRPWGGTGPEQPAGAAAQEHGRKPYSVTSGTATDGTTTPEEPDGEDDTDQEAFEETLGTVRGVVLDASRKPAAGARVQVLGPALREDQVAETVCNATGEFVLTRLPTAPASITLAASWRGLSSRATRCDARQNAGDQPWVELLLESASMLRVTVQDPDARPIPAAKVFVQDTAGRLTLAQALTDEMGEAAFDTVPLGSVLVLAEKIGYAPPAYASQSAGRKELVVAADQPAAALLTLERTASVTGTVVAPSGTPVADASVFVRMLTPSGLQSTASSTPLTRTDQDGHFTLTEAPETRIDLCAVRYGQGMSAWTPSLPGQQQARSVTLTLLPAQGITGTVRDSRNRPVQGAIVSFGMTDPLYHFLPAWRSAVTAADGAFAVQGLPAIDGVLEAKLGEDTGKRTLTADDVSARVPVDLVLGDQEQLEWNGYVITPQGAIATTPSVRLHGPGGVILRSATVEDDGFFTLRLTGPGPWTVSIAAPGAAPLLRQVTRDGFAAPENIVLSNGATLVIPVSVDLPAEAIPAGTTLTTTLTFRDVPKPPFVHTQTATLVPDMNVTFPGLTPGIYLCELVPRDLAARSFTVRVNDMAAPQAMSNSVAVTLGGIVQGRVVTPAGQVMPGAIVRVDGASIPRTTTEQDGTFALFGVPPGQRRLRAATADSYGLSAPLTVTSGGVLAAADIVLDQEQTPVAHQTTMKISIGIGWRERDGHWEVGHVAPDSSAAAAALRAGDILTAADGVPAQEWSREQLLNAMSGEPGTSVALTLERDGTAFTVRLERQVVDE